MPSAVNYSKWDALAAELDDEDDATAARAAAARGAQKAVPQPGSAEYKASVDHHSMAVIPLRCVLNTRICDEVMIYLQNSFDINFYMFLSVFQLIYWFSKIWKKS